MPSLTSLDRDPLDLGPVPYGHTLEKTDTIGADFTIVSTETRRWMAMAIGSLLVAGLLSLAVVIGRLPFIARFIDDPLLFKRCLVVHVDLALVVWFYSFISGLLSMLGLVKSSPLRTCAYVASATGVALMMAGALVPDAQPVLANYIPVIDHPLFLAGLVTFFAGIICLFVVALASSVLDRQTSDALRFLPRESAIGFQVAAVAVVLAGATWLATQSAMPKDLDVVTFYEFSFWGAGHVLQVANVCAMIAIWFWLLKQATGVSMVSSKVSRWLFLLLVVPHFSMPVLTARGPMDSLYHHGATQLMRWGIFPVVTFVLILGIRHLWRHRNEVGDDLRRMARIGFLSSAGLTAIGFVLGACIRGSTTLIPAHYHASLGGITAALMAVAYLMFKSFGSSELEKDDSAKSRSGKRQLALYGIGQTIFVLGFAIGGVYGLGRKTYASEQVTRGFGEILGLSVMGIGGLVAAVAGIWFLVAAIRGLRAWTINRQFPSITSTPDRL